MKTRNLLYLLSLMAIIFISIPKILNATEPDEDCGPIIFTCPDGTQGMGIICTYTDYLALVELLCNPQVAPPDTGPSN